MPAGALLTIAIISEVTATVSLRYVEGLSRPLPLALVVTGYTISFWMLSLVLKELAIGTTYAIWAGTGTAAVAVIGMLALGEPASAVRVASLALIILGVIGINLSGPS